MSRWPTDLPPSIRAAAYFLPREEAVSRMARVMQTGQAVYLACHEHLTDWTSLIDALGVTSLAELDEAAYLILDDTDVLEAKTLACLVRTLLRDTQHVRLILFGRRPLIDLYADSTIAPVYQCFIGPHQIDSPYETGHLILYVETFGAGRVFANGRLIENWNGPQQLETLFALLDLLPATQEALLLALFGEISDEAYNKFHASKSYIKRALDNQEVTTRGWSDQREQGYYLSDRILVYSDFQTYSKLTNQMFDHKVTTQNFMLSASALMRLAYRDYMATTPSAYLDQKRLQIRHTLSQILAQAGRLQWVKGDSARAEALLTRALRVDRTNQDAIEVLIRFYRQEGRPLEAAEVYERWHEQSAGDDQSAGV